MAISRRGFAVRAEGFQLFGAEWVRRLHPPRLGTADTSPYPKRVEVQRLAQRQSKQAARQQQLLDRLLVAATDRPSASFESLPALFEAPDLLTNPRLAPLVTAIDSRLLAPLYRDVDHHNGRLKFFLTGHEHKPASSFYVRSFLPHFHQNNLFYLNREGLERKDTDGLPWQPLATLMTDVFASMGVTELRDFYTHVLPAGVGRHAPHRDRLQSGTWKVDIRWSPQWTELLFLDAEDACWYALRFPPGGSGFVIDSALFRRFHAVRAGPAIQQSVLLVFNQQGTTMHMVREAFVARANALPLSVSVPVLVPMSVPNRLSVSPTLTDAGGAAARTDAMTATGVMSTAASVSVASSEHGGAGDGDAVEVLPTFAFPVAAARHPRAAEALRVTKQSVWSFRNSVQRLRVAVLAIEPGARAWMRVPQTVIDQAVATFPVEERPDMLQTFNQCKIRQHFAYAADHSTSIEKNARRQTGRTLRRNVDYRYVSIQGSATVEGKTFHFPAYDGTEATRLWFGWQHYGMWYRTTVSVSSSNELSVSLAALVASQKIRTLQSNSQYWIDLQIDGDSVVGPLAALLRELGLTLQVVREEGELDNQTKRTRELERVAASASGPVRARPLALAGRGAPIRNPWHYFLQERCKVATKGFLELTAEGRKVYEDKAAADKSRYQEEMSKLGKSTPRPASAFSLFIKDHPSSSRKAWALLSPQEKQRYQAQSRTELREWQRSTGVEGVKRPSSAHFHFLQDFVKASKPMYDRLSPAERGVYEDKAREGRQRYEEQESQWSGANQQAPSTAFEVFRAETGPVLLSESSKFSGREGQRRLNRELRAQWRRLSRSDWAEYERKLQTEVVPSHRPEIVHSAST